MSYYLLPSNTNMVQIKPPDMPYTTPIPYNLYWNMFLYKYSIQPVISQSLYFYYITIKNQLLRVQPIDPPRAVAVGTRPMEMPAASIQSSAAAAIQEDRFNNIIKMVHPFEQIHTIMPPPRIAPTAPPGLMPTQQAAVQYTPIFYDMLEVVYTLNLMSGYANLPFIKAIHIGNKSVENYQYLSYIRDNPADKHFYFHENINTFLNYSFHYIFYDIDTIADINELNIKNYIIQFVKIILFVLKCQMADGVCVIKLTHIFHKPIIDLVYMLTILYDKVVIIKPSTSNVISFDKYLVCRGFVGSKNADQYYTDLNNWLNYFMTNNNDIISTMINEKRDTGEELSPIYNQIPLYFMNKLNDINIILGQKQLDALDQLIYVLKNKHKDEKMELLRKQNIQKCVMWCKKYRLPFYEGA